MTTTVSHPHQERSLYSASNMNLYSFSGTDAVTKGDGGLLVGATTTFESLFKHPEIYQYAAIFMALRNVNNAATRRQKMVGRVLSPDFASQGLAAAMMALDTQLLIAGSGETRATTLSHFCTKDLCVLRPGETVKRFFIPEYNCQNSVYHSVDFLPSGQALCGVAAWAYKTNGTIDNVRIILSGCTPVPVYLERMSNIMIGRECTMEEIEKAIQRLEEERLVLQNPQLVIGSHLFNLSKTLIKRALMTL